MSRCGSCGAEISWVMSDATGKRMPLDAIPNPEGNVVVIPGTQRASVLGPLERALARQEGDELFMPHFATCPHAKEHRR